MSKFHSSITTIHTYSYLPVMWYIEINPNPNRPTLIGSVSLVLWYILDIDSQSSSENTALFHDNNAGPWNFFNPCRSWGRSSTLCWRSSIINFIWVAPASSAFCISSYTHIYAHAYTIVFMVVGIDQEIYGFPKECIQINNLAINTISKN